MPTPRSYEQLGREPAGLASGWEHLRCPIRQRGRDHCLAAYNDCREAYGLPRVDTFAHMVTDQHTRSQLQLVYRSPDDVDLWIGCLAEAPVHGAVGPLMYAILREQFLRLRDADRFWFENDPFFTAEDRLEINNTTLAHLVEANAGVTGLPDNVFNVDGKRKLLVTTSSGAATRLDAKAPSYA